MEDPVSALLANVDRLLNESNILLCANAHGSATTLAILAFEEAGHAYTLHFNLAPTMDGVDIEKYRYATALIGLGFATLRTYGIDEQRVYEDILPFVQNFPGESGTFDPVERLQSLVRTTIEPVMRGQSDETNVQMALDVRRLLEIGRLVQAGEVKQVRERAVKVGTDAEGRMVSQPASVSRDTAELWAWAAGGVLHLLRQGEHRHPDILQVTVLMQTLGQNPGGQRLAA